MLLSLRDRVKGSKVLRTVLIGIIAIPFALFGIGSYLGGGGSYWAAKVNDEEVSIQAYEQNYFLQRNQLRAAFGGIIPPGFDSASLLRNQALETSITQALLLKHTNENGYATSDEVVASAIFNEQAFQDGETFSKERYEAQLQSLGMTAQQFEEQLRQDLSVNQMREGLVFTAFKTRADLEKERSLRNQTRTFTEIVFPADDFEDIQEPDDQAIEEYYTSRPAQFRYPESVKLAYLELDQAKLVEKVVASEDDLRGLYEEQQSNYMTPERRRASHILLNVADDLSESETSAKRELLESLRERVLTGESFSDLALEYSEDPGSAADGGDLGAFPRGVMIPEVEQAAFELSEGNLSDIVASSFGLHLIRLDEIIPGEGKTYEQALPEVEQTYRSREAEGLFFELSDSLANEVYENSDTLDTAATAIDAEVVETDWLEAGSSSGIFRYPAVRQVAFSSELLEEGVNSDVIEVGNNHVVVIRVREHRPERAKDIEDVREEIVNTLKSNARDEQLKAQAEQAQLALEGGQSLEVLTSGSRATVNDEVTVGREDASVDASVLSELFKMAKPDGNPIYSVAKKLSGDYAVIALNSVNDEGTSPTGTETSDNATRLLGQSEYAAWIASMRERATVTINDQLLDEVTSQRQ